MMRNSRAAVLYPAKLTMFSFPEDYLPKKLLCRDKKMGWRLLEYEFCIMLKVNCGTASNRNQRFLSVQISFCPFPGLILIKKGETL